MSVGAVEITLTAYLVLGTFVLKFWNNGIDHEVFVQRLSFILGSIGISVLPLVVLQSNDELRTAVSVVLAGVIAVWFAIICSRDPKPANLKNDEQSESERGT